MASPAIAAQTVLIVDDDLGFVCFWATSLNEAGYRALPALSCGEAIAVSRHLGVRPDLVILNPSLAGASRMLQNFVQAKHGLKIVTIGPPLNALGGVHAILERPRPSQPILRHSVSRTLENHSGV